MEQFLQQVLSGIASGSLFAILALSLVMIYRSTSILNFAQGEMALFSTFIAWSFLTTMDFGRASIGRANVVILVAAVIVMAILFLLFQQTKLGLAMRAVAQNRLAS